MNCDDVRGLAHAYADRELDAAHDAEVDRHLAHCETCPPYFESQRALQSTLRNNDLYFNARPELRRRVEGAIRTAQAPLSTRGPSRWIGLAAAAVIAAIVIFAIVAQRSNPSRLGEEIVSAHIRSLMANHLTDVPSSDQHTVKPWFNGKLDFSPPVVDLKTEGFPLIGGRLDYIGNRPVAALVYRRNGHIINVFVWPAASNLVTSDRLETQHGYNLIEWKGNQTSFTAVSDVNADELRRFSQLFRAGVSLSS